MSQLSVKEHLDGILSDFEALKRSFDVEDAGEDTAFSSPRSRLSPEVPRAVQIPGNAEGRGGGPVRPTYQSRISLMSNASPAHCPVLKTSLSFNRGTVHSPRDNGTNLGRVSSFQTRLNPNGYGSSLGPGSDNESLHSSSSSLECPVLIKGPPNIARPSDMPRTATPELQSVALKKFSSHSNVFCAEGDQPIHWVSSATANQGSLPSLDLHIAEDQGLGLPLCFNSGPDPKTTWTSGDQNSSLAKKTMVENEETLSQLLDENQLENMTLPTSRPMVKLQKFPLSLDGLLRKPTESVTPTEMSDSSSIPPSEVQLQLNVATRQCQAMIREDLTVTKDGVSLSFVGESGHEILASPPQAETSRPVPPQIPSQSTSCGQPETVSPQGSPSPSIMRDGVTTERTSSVSHKELAKVPRDNPSGVAKSPPHVSKEEDASRGRSSSKEEHPLEFPRLNMEDDPVREMLSREAPLLGSGGSCELFGYVGIEAVLDQMHLKTMKSGFEFNIMVVGQSGLGKSTMVNTLFKSKVSRKSCPGFEERIPKTVQLHSVTQIVEEKGVKMKLTVTDTPGFGDQINNQDCWEPIVEYINDQYERYLREEILINRKKKIPDTRIHACVYFIPPTGHWLRPLDLEFMRQLGKITNVVPVIAKADTLTLEERAEFRQRIQKDLKAHGVEVYPQVEFDEDPDDRLLNDKIREKIPFAVVGADKEHQVNGKRVLGRKTKWGVIEVENLSHSEFPLLRDLLIRTHLQDLKDFTHSLHYEQYRVRRLNETNQPHKIPERLRHGSISGEPESQL